MNWERIFVYENTAIVRRHFPVGYSDYSAYKDWLRDDFEFRCVYCLDREQFASDGSHRFAVEHVEPKSRAPHRETDYSNLLYSCNRCNVQKGLKPVADPTATGFGHLLRFKETGEYESLSNEGVRLIRGMDLNHPNRVRARKWILVICKMACQPGAHPELIEAAKSYLKYPDDLPDLRRKLPPGGNGCPESHEHCHYARRGRGELPEWY